MAHSPVFILTLAIVCGLAAAKGSKSENHGFLEPEGKEFMSMSRLSLKAFQKDLKEAMSAMLGCGGEAKPEKIAAIRKTLMPMWVSLPKTNGRIDRRSLRYLVHRYFAVTSSLSIRGFEPSRPTNASNWGVADILSQAVPAYVESILESRHATTHGFGLEDTISMVVMLHELIFDAEASLLEKVFFNQGKSMQRLLSHTQLQQVLEAYMVEWMVEGEPADLAMLLANRTLLAEVVPHFEQLMDFAEGRIKALQYANDKKVPKGRAGDTLSRQYTFGDAHQIVGGITTSFQSYWQSECDVMKASLVSMDKLGTGRIPLSNFYNTAISTDWRFGESESYLRELGALDESSSWASPQVIIPNYIQSTSNCIVSTAHYLVCCTNECETLLGEIETAVGAPTSTPKEILEIVGNMTAQTTLDDDDSPLLLPDSMITLQLQQVANTNGGVVPLHGRLFGQWLHYVFPHECPFPHKVGMVSAVTPTQYGDEYIANDKEMRKYAANASAESEAPVPVGKEDLQWMSQWDPEEEFSVDYSSELSMPWQQQLMIAFVGLLLISFGAWGGVIKWGKNAAGPSTMAGTVKWSV